MQLCYYTLAPLAVKGSDRSILELIFDRMQSRVLMVFKVCPTGSHARNVEN